jgi:DNA-binding CsgD family transcriptional regulator
VSYSTLPVAIRETAEAVLTTKQLDVFKLWCAGAGTARIAIMLGIAEPTARAHLTRAKQKINERMERDAAAA